VTSLWERHVVPRIVELCCGTAQMHQVRERVCAGLVGDVLEIGFGSGHNASHYPDTVERVLAVEPSDVGFRLAGKRLASSAAPVERIGLDGQALPLADASVDSALSTWTLCTIPDGVAALREVRRVLRPGGRLHFVEHGLSPHEGVVRWQRRLEPFQRRVSGGCHLTRPIPTMLAEAGFTVERLDTFYEKGVPKPFGYLYEGVAQA
jgi:SAM-dependent methyltransferase